MFPFNSSSPRGASASILYVLPTMTYMAYANDRRTRRKRFKRGAGDGEPVRTRMMCILPRISIRHVDLRSSFGWKRLLLLFTAAPDR